MNEWLIASGVLLVALGPLTAAALRRPAAAGLPALQVAGVDAALALVCLAFGIARPLFLDLAVVTGVLGFAGTLAFAAVLERHR